MACCCDDLEEAGFDTDLGTYGLGKGRLLVPARLAQRAIGALRRHCETTGYVSTSSDVVVSQELKSIFCEQVAMMDPRINRLVRTHQLLLGPREPHVQIRKTFAELVASSSSSSAVMRSL